MNSYAPDKLAAVIMSSNISLFNSFGTHSKLLMAKKKKIPDKYQKWIDARKRFHLSHAHIKMARELRLNPKKFGSLANTKQEPWKLPLPQFIDKIYFKHSKKERPDNF